MKSHNTIYITLITLITIGLVACSTARKSVKTEETLTQTSEVRTDTSSFHAATTKTDSTLKESWEEMVIEWDNSLRSYENDDENENGTSCESDDYIEGLTQRVIDSETSELVKTLQALQKAGVKKATLKKGQATKTMTKTQTDTTAEAQSTSVQNKTEEKAVKEETTKTQRPGWWYALMYLIAIAVAYIVIITIVTVIKRWK